MDRFDLRHFCSSSILYIRISVYIIYDRYLVDNGADGDGSSEEDVIPLALDQLGDEPSSALALNGNSARVNVLRQKLCKSFAGRLAVATELHENTIACCDCAGKRNNCQIYGVVPRTK